MIDRLARLGSRPSNTALDRIALITSLVLVVLLAWNLADLTWTLLPRPDQPAAPAPAPRTAAAGGDAAPDFGRVAQLHLFGEAQREAQQAPIDAPETRLNLTLRGILYNPDPEEARAIVAAPGQEEKGYSVGGTLPGGATIEQIHPDRVILSRGGRYETLRLPEDSLPDVVRQAPAPQQQAPGQGGLGEYRERLVQNPQNVTQFLQTEPAIEGGQFRGFRVYPGPSGDLFERSDLQPGDLVVSVNGMELDSMDKGLQALRTIAQADALELTVLRDGQPHSVQLQFD